MAAKERLARERINIFEQFPLAQVDFDKPTREAYGFAYIRAERLGVKAIHRRMAEVSWLPAQIDTSTDITPDTREKIAGWVKNGEGAPPGTDIFGNEFIHVLSRCLMVSDSDSNAFHRLADRIAILFRDLAFLVSSIHCCNIFREMQIEYLQLTAPNDLGRVALDLTSTLEGIALLHSGERKAEVNENKPSGKAAHLRLVVPLEPQPDAPPG